MEWLKQSAREFLFFIPFDSLVVFRHYYNVLSISMYTHRWQLEDEVGGWDLLKVLFVEIMAVDESLESFNFQRTFLQRFSRQRSLPAYSLLEMG